MDTDGERHIRFVTDTPDCRVKVVEGDDRPGRRRQLRRHDRRAAARGWNSAEPQVPRLRRRERHLRTRARSRTTTRPRRPTPTTAARTSRASTRAAGAGTSRRTRSCTTSVACRRRRPTPPARLALHRRVRRHVLRDAPGVTLTTPCNVFGRDAMLDCNHDDYFHTNPAAGQLPRHALERRRQQVPHAGSRRACGGTCGAGPRPCGRDARVAAWQGNSTGAVNTVERTGTGAYTITFPNLGTFPIARNGGGGTVHVTAYGNGTEWCNVRSWQPTPSTLDGDLQVEVRCFTAAGTPVDTQFTAMFVRPFTYDQPRFGYVWADQPSAASYTPSATYSYNGNGALGTRTRSRGRHRAATRSASPGSAAPPAVGGAGHGVRVGQRDLPGDRRQAAPTGRTRSSTSRATPPPARRSTRPFTLSYHERTGCSACRTGPAPRGYVISDAQNAGIHTPSVQYNSSGGLNRISRRRASASTACACPASSSAGGHVQVGAVPADGRRAPLQGRELEPRTAPTKS